MDATIDLVLEGRIPPAPAEIAERAGVSAASLFRYFDTLDELRTATTQLYFERFRELFEVPAVGVGSLPTRVRALVDARVTLYETVEPMARLARSRSSEVQSIDDTLHRVRSTFIEQIRAHFAPELSTMSAASADDAVTVVAALTSFESWDQARHDHGRSPAQTRRAWHRAVERILAV